MRQHDKQAIASALREYCELKGSQNAAARSIQGVSSATVSQMLNGQWELIRDEMWRNVAAQIGYDRRNWVVVRTRGFRRMTDILSDAKDKALVMAVTGEAGCGKSESIKVFAKSHKNVIHLMCSEYWNRKVFMTELLAQLSISCAGYTVSEMMSEIISTIKKRESPIIILDEADKLSDQVLYFFISLYNHLEDNCGIILCATNYLEKRINKGLSSNRKGYKEIYSRIGRKFVPIEQVNADDVEAVCAANGVQDEDTIEDIIEKCDYDLRRVRRLVHAERRRRESLSEATTITTKGASSSVAA